MPHRGFILRLVVLPCLACLLSSSYWLPKRLFGTVFKGNTSKWLDFGSGSSFTKNHTSDEWSLLKDSLVCQWETSPVFQDSTTDLPQPPLILTHAVKRNATLSKEDFILVTHISIQKLDVLLLQLRRFGGPASVAVYLSSPVEIEAFCAFLRQHQHAELRQTTFHVVLERGRSSSTNTNTYERPLYPHNILRNVALQTIECDYFVALDVDFIPAQRTHDRLLEYLLLQPQSNGDDFRHQLQNKKLFVLPAFELFPREGERFATEDMLPDSKSQVIAMVKEQRLVPFRKSAPVGHLLTNFDRWLGQVLPEEATDDRSFLYYYDIPLRGTKRREVWEPYVVGYRPGIHRYWEDFRGYGFDKFSFFIESQLAGYTFVVLADLFCVHLNHPEVSKDEQARLLERNRVYYANFILFLSERYGKNPPWLPATSDLFQEGA